MDHRSVPGSRQQVKEVDAAEDSHQHAGRNLHRGKKVAAEAVGRQQQYRAAQRRRGKQHAVVLADQPPGEMRRHQTEESNVAADGHARAGEHRGHAEQQQALPLDRDAQDWPPRRRPAKTR